MLLSIPVELKFKNLHITRIFTALILLSLFTACANNTMRNIPAKYNGYFYADLRLQEVLDEIENSGEKNYNEVLPVFPGIDSNLVNGNKEKLDDVFTKASRVVEWHKNSDWVDDGYLIVGKVRYLRRESQEAIETFQYINKNSDNDDTKHAALIALMWHYIEAEEPENALQVASYLKNEKLSDENSVAYHTGLAHFYQKEDDLIKMANNLIEIIDLMDNKKKKSKVNFILGQVHQKLGYDNEAYDYYKDALKGNPPYELAFYAQLNMQQVAVFKNAEDVEKIRKYYRSLLKDGKNVDYQGKIYYEMGEFERKQNNIDLALENYLLGTQVKSPTQRQKALLYLRAGQLYYEPKEDFEQAKKYYDSTIAILPSDESGYETIKKRQEVLADFVKQLNIIHTNDSLLSLAQMNPVSLDAYLDNYLIEKEKKELEQQKKERKARRNEVVANQSGQTSAFNAVSPIEGNEGWYFYNAAAVDQGKMTFQRIWGNRPLEDNWRRSNKTQLTTGVATGETDGEVVVTENMPSTENSREQAKKELLQNIPLTDTAKMEAHFKIQEAYFNLGSIYQFGLEKIDKSINSYETLIEKYPSSSFKPEALLALHLIYKESDPSKAEYYKQEIIRQFPENLIAKLLINPNYLIEKEARNVALQKVYENAYDAFEAGNYQKAELTLNSALADFEDVDFLPTVKLMTAVLKAKTENLFSYEKALTAFTEEYPEGPLFDFANTLLTEIDPAKEKIIRREDFEYSEDLEQMHLVTFLFKNDQVTTSALRADIDVYNQESHTDKNLKTAELIFSEGDDQSVVLINAFDSKMLAETYLKQLNRAFNRFSSLKGANFDNFVISRDNFQMLFQSKEVERYLAFYKRFYQ